MMDRRSALSFGGLGGLATLASFSTPALADDNKGKIVVFGGSGYVGAHVLQNLSSQGYTVVSVSRTADQASKVGNILGGAAPKGVDYQSLDASTANLGDVVSGASAVISCIGVAPGSKNMKEGNSLPNSRIADASKAAGVPRLVYISVASELANGPAKFLLGDYLKGKKDAETAVSKDYGADVSLVIKPSIISGGPPGELRPPGPPGMEPVSVKAVANAAVAGALGRASGTIDGNAAIGAYSN